MQKQVEIEKLNMGDEIPFHLLLLADENTTAISKYIHISDVFVARFVSSEEVIGVFVLHHLNGKEIEIKNIAVAENYQGRGIGSLMIDKIKQIALEHGAQTLWVGTPDSAMPQLNFYQRKGFSVTGMRTNFFKENYAEPIYENGIMLKDMVMLQFCLNENNNAE
jgi:ribosomal protein S18 acetylase RimI-like enzyme